VRERVARSRELVARGHRAAVVARVMQISRQAIYRTPKPRIRPGPRPARGTVDRAIVEVAKANPTDGTRMVAALAARELDRPVSRKRAQRVMRSERLLQHMDMTSIWVAEHGWCYLNAIVDCCTREIPAFGLDLRCRRQEAEGVLKAGVEAHAIGPGRLTLGTDNGTAYTSRGFRARLAGLEIAHRRGGYRDPESQAFIESWFSKLKERLIWRSELETLEDARAAIAAYVDAYHHRPHSGLGYRTPKEVRKTWEDAQDSEATTNSRGLG
jgi:putative transposase